MRTLDILITIVSYVISYLVKIEQESTTAAVSKESGDLEPLEGTYID